MGRGNGWDAEENETLASAWIAASQDPIAGANQKNKTFADTLHRRFVEKGPKTADVPEGKYGYRTVLRSKNHFADVSADVQKFHKALRRIKAANPTGVSDSNILSMAVAIHTEKTKIMEYIYKDYYKDNWIYFRAWRVLSKHPKWASAQESSSDSSGVIVSTSSSADGGVAVEDQEEGGSRLAEGSTAPPTSPRSTPSKNEDRFKLGGWNAKLIKQEELRTHAVRSMADSAKRKSDALEERKAIAVFSHPDAAGLPEAQQFFNALRSTYLTRALKRAKLEASEAARGGVPLSDTIQKSASTATPVQSTPSETNSPSVPNSTPEHPSPQDPS